MNSGFLKTNRFLVPLVLLLVGVLALFLWDRHPAISQGSMESPSTGGDLYRRNVYFGARNSIAVLPFADVSAGLDQSHLAAGFSAELTALLTGIQRLRVTSATSSFYFRDASAPAQVIAERLQVSYLVTGDFHLLDDRINLKVRLIDAKSNSPVWLQSFERSFDELAAIQQEILTSVLDGMSLDQPDKLPVAMPVTLAAWIDYLQGRYLLGLRSADELRSAEQSFQAALEMEPEFERARLGLAETWLMTASTEPGRGEAVEKAREELMEILQANPQSAQAFGLLSYIRRHDDWDWRGSAEAARRAVELNPGDADLKRMAGLARFTLGQFDEAEHLLQSSINQDPLNLGSRLHLGLVQEFAGKYDMALSTYRQILGLNSDFPGAHAYRARIKIAQENPESALRESDQEPDAFWRRYSRVLALDALERPDEASELLDQMILNHGNEAAFQIAEILASRGDEDLAFDWLHKAIDQRDGGMAELIGNRFFKNLHDDPRWREMLSHLSLPLD
jgi:TolB-like protein/thioredoxin-like negative regulator of GroEL